MRLSVILTGIAAALTGQLLPLKKKKHPHLTGHE